MMLDVTPFVTLPLSPRKEAVWKNAEREAPRRGTWRKKASFFHKEDTRYLKFLIPPGLRVLELGCGRGDTLAMLQPFSGDLNDVGRHSVCDPPAVATQGGGLEECGA